MSNSIEPTPTLDLSTIFPFKLDRFQLNAIAALDAGKSVVVCAPTGSGKTLIGEYAIHRALSQGKRVFYTTPLKALSNQKLRDFRNQFGAELVGLLTGDSSINRDAPILIMTTEIFRNMLYGTPIGEVGTSLEGVEAVVLDECHYMNDRQRGTVWEESIIYCPPSIQLVALSATVANSDQLTDWLSNVHGPTELIDSDHRPVPLLFHFCNTKGMFPLLDDDRKAINRLLKPKKTHHGKQNPRRRYTEGQQGRSLAGALKSLEKQDLLPTIYLISGRRGCDRAVTDLKLESVNLLSRKEATAVGEEIDAFLREYPRFRQQKSIKSLYRGLATYHGDLAPMWRQFIAYLYQQGLIKVLFVPETLYAMHQLQRRQMLPAIYFIFSRRGCDLAMDECYAAVHELQTFSLVTPEEAEELHHRIESFLARNPEAGRPQHLEPLYAGIAAHHAGILPVWKVLVEELFTRGLIKVVFATETLAAGINMPARTTLISSLSKRTDEGIRLLKPSEFLQMSGRAGRRGMDRIGHVVTIQTPFEGAEEAAYLATVGADPLVSQFTPSYGMVLNLLQTHDLAQAKNLVERSFGQYLSTSTLVPEEAAIEALETEVKEIESQFNLQAEQSFTELEENIANYEKLQERLREEKRLLKTLEQQAEESRTQYMAEALEYAVLGTVLSLQGKHVSKGKSADAPVAATLVARTPSPGQLPYLLCLSQDNRWYVVSAQDVVALHGDLPRVTGVDYVEIPNIPFKLGQRRRGEEVSEAVAEQIPDVPSPPLPPEVATQLQQVQTLDEQLESHPIHQWGKPQKLIKRWRRWTGLKQEIHHRRSELQKYLGRHWQDFLDLINILQEFEALNGLEPTPLGQATAAVRGDNELWLGMALMSKELDHLAPSQLAAACAVLVTEVSRSDSWTNYQLSEEIEDALSHLWESRKALIKAQSERGVEFMVLPERWEHQQISALVEQWAEQVSWSELLNNTSLDEGDLVRIFRRTLDFLSQIPHVPYISIQLQQNAKAARQLIDKFPINETVG